MAYLLTSWRLLTTGVADCATNMAIDEAILRAVAAELVPPTLRLYAWEPPCLSLGQAQSCSEVDWEACAARGYTVVRRPTGGRAILHTDELTYSVTAPEDEPRVQGGIVESYRRLSEGLIEGLRLMGVPGIEAHHPEQSANNTAQGPVCFEVPSTYEVTVAGKVGGQCPGAVRVSCCARHPAAVVTLLIACDRTPRSLARPCPCVHGEGC
jgi:lipoate-protein ligase A